MHCPMMPDQQSQALNKHLFYYYGNHYHCYYHIIIIFVLTIIIYLYWSLYNSLANLVTIFKG